jgi:hypothetical protein
MRKGLTSIRDTNVVKTGTQNLSNDSIWDIRFVNAVKNYPQD